MVTKIFENETIAGEYIVGLMADCLKQKPDALICIAAGHTSLPVFETMKKRKENGSLDLSEARFVAMDEWADLPLENAGSCGNFLNRNCFVPLGIDPEKIVLFDSFGGEQECRRVADYVESAGGIDFLVLGMGMNGHLALNEPGSERYSTARKTKLSDTTAKVAPKYFGGSMPDITHGLTLGLKELLGSKKTILAVFGAHKAEIVKAFMAAEPSPAFPAAFVKELENAEFVVDQSCMLNVK